ncbi:hypothetical protein QL285_011539 [Trifolium repens]|nr:hypothetical protein QL285_011539 [Trifolium repens]
MANLKDKKYLEELHMYFNKIEREEMNDSVVERNVSVLEALQPNSNLKRLTIVNYNGNSFPNWLRGSHLPNFVSLKLEYCGLCSHLPPLGHFPLLKELYIGYCPELKRVSPQHLPSLQELKITNCNKLEECLCLEGSPLLENVSINNCSKLKVTIPKGDSMIKLDLHGCDRILVNGLSTVLKKFVLCENQYTEFSEEEDLVNCCVLEVLEFDLRGFPSLDLQCYNSLRYISIRGCDSSFSLPFSLHLFTNLHYLYLCDCPQLESFPRGGLPSNLRLLDIHNCPKLIGSREEWGLFQLNSLQWFTVTDEFENVESFPEENLLPPTLEHLWMIKCSKLGRMNNKGFLHLNSLRDLRIDNCPSLERLPEEGLQQLSSLYYLEFGECPIIREKYKMEGGERWHTIRHIPNVSYY